jgi:hypothetical protein
MRAQKRWRNREFFASQRTVLPREAISGKTATQGHFPKIELFSLEAELDLSVL